MYITDTQYLVLPTKLSTKPRDRFVRYYNDLYDLEKKVRPMPETYSLGGQYTHAELGEHILKYYKDRDLLKSIELLVIAYWSHEFDPDYSFGAYLCEKFGIQAKNFDICDQGILSPIIAMQVINCFISSNINKALLICFDQTTIPINDDYKGPMPTENSAFSIIFERAKSINAKYKVVSAKCAKKEMLDAVIEGQDNVINIGYGTESLTKYSCPGILSSIFESKYNESIVDSHKFHIHDYDSSDVGTLYLEKLNQGH